MPKKRKPQKKWKPKKSKQEVLDDTIEEDEEEANRARSARSMEAARSGVHDKADFWNMAEDTAEVRDMVEFHDTAEVSKHNVVKAKLKML